MAKRQNRIIDSMVYMPLQAVTYRDLSLVQKQHLGQPWAYEAARQTVIPSLASLVVGS